MKIIQISKFTALLTTMCVVTAQAQLSLKLDRDLLDGNNVPMIPVMPLKGSLQYEAADNEVLIQSEYPVICNRVSDTYSPVSNLQVRYTDPNGENRGDIGSSKMLFGVQSNISYNLSEKTVSIKSENRNKGLCVSLEGLDVIFNNKFGDEVDPPLISDVNYVLNNVPQNGYTPGDSVDYYVEYQNLTGLALLVDFMEYYPKTDGSSVYFSGLSGFGCSILDGSDVFVSGCTISDGAVRDVNLLANHKVRISAIRELSDDASKVGEDLLMMAVVFAKVATLDGISESIQVIGGASSQSFAGFDKQFLKITVVAPN